MKMMRRATALLALAVVAALLASAAAETVSDADDVDAAGGVDAEARRPKLVKYRVSAVPHYWTMRPGAGPSLAPHQRRLPWT